MQDRGGGEEREPRGTPYMRIHNRNLLAVIFLFRFVVPLQFFFLPSFFQPLSTYELSLVIREAFNTVAKSIYRGWLLYIYRYGWFCN